jgi:hypothetical protein
MTLLWFRESIHLHLFLPQELTILGLDAVSSVGFLTGSRVSDREGYGDLARICWGFWG